MTTTPPDKPNGNGEVLRGPGGKFLPGTAAGPGSPHVARLAHMRTTLLEAVSDDDIRDVWAALTKAAKGGDVGACRVWLDRVYGKDHDLCSDEVPSKARMELIALLDGPSNE